MRRVKQDMGVIAESAPWKRQLGSDADLIERWSAKTAVTERRSILLERKIFLAAYAIRKLAHAWKLASSFDDLSVQVERYPATKGGISPLNSHRFDDFYDLSAAAAERLPAKRLLDLLIHSFLFAEQTDEAGAVVGFLLTSDTTRVHSLYRVAIADFVALMRRVAADDAANAIRYRDDATGEWKAWNGRGQPPRHILKKVREALRQPDDGTGD
jgi:hypothetical protein